MNSKNEQNTALQGFHKIDNVVKRAFEVMESLYGHGICYDFVPTGYKDLDTFSGLMSGDLFILCGAPGSGLSSLAVNIFHKLGVSKQSMPTAFFSLQHGMTHVGRQLLSLEGRLLVNNIRQAKIKIKDWSTLTNAAGRLVTETPLYVFTEPVPVDQLIHWVSELKKPEALRVVIIDNLQLLSERRSYEDCLRNLKLMAQETGVTVLLTCGVRTRRNSHTGREAVNDPIFRLLEKYGDVIMRLSKRRVHSSSKVIDEKDGFHFTYDQSCGMVVWTPGDDVLEKYSMELVVVKNAHGPAAGTVDLMFTPQKCIIEDAYPH